MNIEQMEAREYRCCMCPQRDEENTVCPTGDFKDTETICDFVITWTDKRGWKYKIMKYQSGTFKGHYQDNKHSGCIGWHGMRQMERREYFDKAQEDLNHYAISKGWKINV